MATSVVAASILASPLLPIGKSLAASAFYTGNDLLARCESKTSDFDQSECYGYLLGLTDMYAVTAGRKFLCMPEGVTAGQVRDVIVRYLVDHPEQRHLLAPGIAAAALVGAFPCD